MSRGVIMVENGYVAGLVFVVAMQGFRQLTPNIFAYLWQEHTCNIVPEKGVNTIVNHLTEILSHSRILYSKLNYLSGI